MKILLLVLFALPSLQLLKDINVDATHGSMTLRGGCSDKIRSQQSAEPPRKFDIVVIGGGVAAGYCVKEWISGGPMKESVCVVSEENVHPYERPALTKGYLAGTLKSPRQGGFLCLPKESYVFSNIELMLSTKVVQIDFKKRVLTTKPVENGGTKRTSIEYSKLVLATGVGIERLAVPGCQLKNVFHIRCLCLLFVIRQKFLDQEPCGRRQHDIHFDAWIACCCHRWRVHRYGSVGVSGGARVQCEPGGAGGPTS